MKLWFIAAALLAGAASANAQDQCDNLWFERNQFYKDAGYCFATVAGRRAFGNAECVYTDQNAVPLSNYARSRIAQIVRAERALGCRR